MKKYDISDYQIAATLGVIKDLREAIQDDIDDYEYELGSPCTSYDGFTYAVHALDRLKYYDQLIDGIEFYLTNNN